MKFYVIEASNGETIGCELTRKAAIATAASYGYKPEEYVINMVRTKVCADTVRRLLGQLGGYAEAAQNARPD